MKVFERHEQLEMLVLDEMRKAKILDRLIFGGGTMLRLCFDLPRYSTDLDFYILKKKSFGSLARKWTNHLANLGAKLVDVHEKHFTYLWEIKVVGYPRNLKIEIRKKHTIKTFNTMLAIAHSEFAPTQVRLRALTLEQSWLNKIEALLSRKEIRDAYDLEFLSLRKAGDFSAIVSKKRQDLAAIIDNFTPITYKVTLGSVLKKDDREQVLSSKFAYLKSKILAP